MKVLSEKGALLEARGAAVSQGVESFKAGEMAFTLDGPSVPSQP